MKKHILLIGEKSIDKWIIGRCPRISPEAPVPIFIPTDKQENLGMAGNVMCNILSLSSFSVDFLCPDNVIEKIRYVDDQSGQQIVRVDIGDDSLSPLTFSDFLSFVASRERSYDAIVFSEYGKGYLSIDVMRKISQWGKQRAIPVFGDTKHFVDSWATDFFVIKINRREADAHPKEPWPYCENLIITEGRDGSYLHQRDNPAELIRVNTDRIDVQCVSGAGDTYLAALVIGYLEQKDLIKAMNFASKAAAIAVSKRGVVAVKREEIV